jgi:DNA repair exonuclease SbcCD ATPase subunit
MAPNRSGRSARPSSSAVALVECSIRVSPGLARLIRKSAEKEASGTSAVDALLTTAGIQAGEITSLRKELEQSAKEAMEWREQAAREHVQLEHAEAAVDERDKTFHRDLRKATDSFNEAKQLIHMLEARIAELSAALQSRDKQLDYSVSLFGLSEGAAAAMKALRARLVQDKLRPTSDTSDEAQDMIANFDRPELRNLNKMLRRPGWRLHAIRWLLQVLRDSDGKQVDVPTVNPE